MLRRWIAKQNSLRDVTTIWRNDKQGDVTIRSDILDEVRGRRMFYAIRVHFGRYEQRMINVSLCFGGIRRDYSNINITSGFSLKAMRLRALRVHQ